MDLQADPNGFDVSVPYEQVAIFAASTSGKSDRAVGREYRELQEYLAQKLLAGPSEMVKDRIGIVLRDERYHALTSNLEATVPLQALIELMEAGDEGTVPPKIAIPAALVPRYTQGLALQVEVMRGWIASLTKRSPAKKRATKRKPSVEDVFSFMNRSMPVVLKRAYLAAWTTPMCCIALTAGDQKDFEATRSVLLDAWIDGLRRQLAVYVAVELIDVPSEDVLPAQYRFSMLEVHGKYLQGLGRTYVRMANLGKPQHAELPEPI